jgi:hypothetical protein
MEKKGVFFLDTMVFVLSLCVVALGVILSHIIGQKHRAPKKQEN